MPELVFPPFDQELAERLQGIGWGLGVFQWHPLEGLASELICYSNPGKELVVVFLKAANWMLAVIQDFGVSITP